MAYRLLKGEFHIFYPDLPKNGPEPDGDTLKFKPDIPQFVEAVWRHPLPQPDFNGRGMINLRFEGIDALETHFSGTHQNLKLSLESRNFLLEKAGFGAVEFREDKPNKVMSVENNPVRGYILTNGLDAYGRIVSFVFFGESDERDGEEIYLTPERAASSFNAISLHVGQSYPLFYSSLPKSIMTRLKHIAEAARQAAIGLYKQDDSMPDRTFKVTPQNLQDLVIWPKLFRRLVSYFASDFADLSAFDSWLRRDPRNRDDRVLIPSDHDAHFHNLIHVISAQEMKLVVDPKDVVILPRDFL